jgi:hypothetical protein
MFAPDPPKNGGWYVIAGRLGNGKEIDLFKVLNGASESKIREIELYGVSFEKPLLPSSEFKNSRWKFYMRMLLKKREEAISPFLDYLCKDWNKSHEGTERLKELSFYAVVEKTIPGEKILPIEIYPVAQYKCF